MRGEQELGKKKTRWRNCERGRERGVDPSFRICNREGERRRGRVSGWRETIRILETDTEIYSGRTRLSMEIHSRHSLPPLALACPSHAEFFKFREHVETLQLVERNLGLRV